MTGSISRTIAVVISPLLVGILVTNSASAQTKTWVGGSASWFSNFVWSPPGVPDINSDVFINNGGTARILSSRANMFMRTLLRWLYPKSLL
jgi:hypothetical protein